MIWKEWYCIRREEGRRYLERKDWFDDVDMKERYFFVSEIERERKDEIMFVWEVEEFVLKRLLLIKIKRIKGDFVEWERGEKWLIWMKKYFFYYLMIDGEKSEILNDWYE